MRRRDLLFGALAAPALPKLLEAATPVPLKPGELDLLYGTAPLTKATQSMGSIEAMLPCRLI